MLYEPQLVDYMLQLPSILMLHWKTRLPQDGWLDDSICPLALGSEFRTFLLKHWDSHKTLATFYIYVLSAFLILLMIRGEKKERKEEMLLRAHEWKNQSSMMPGFCKKSMPTKNTPHEIPWMDRL